MVILLLYYHLIIVQCCSSLNETLYFIIKPQETLRLNLSSIFIGSNMSFYPNKMDVNIIYPFKEIQKHKLEYIAYPLQFKPLSNQFQIWLNQFAYLTQDYYSVNITYTIQGTELIFNNILSIQKLEWEDCFDFDYFDSSSFLLLCKKDDDILLYKISIHGHLQSYYILENTQISTKMSFYNSQNFLYLTETNKTHSSITIYQWNNTDLFIFDLINTTTIRKILDDNSINLLVKEIKLLQNDVMNFHDQSLGLFQYKDKQIKVIKDDTFISVDYDQIHDSYAYLYDDYFIIQKQNHILRKVFIDTDFNQISITGQYVLLQGGGIFSIYSLYSGQLLQQINPEGVSVYLTQNNYFITLSNSLSHVYYLSHPYLIIDNEIFYDDFSLYVKDNNGNCSITIYVKQIAENDNKLYSFTESQTLAILTPFYEKQIDSFVLGPNQQFSCQSNQIDCKVQQKTTVTNNIISLSTINKQQMQTIDEYNHILVQQLSNSQLMLSKCQLKENYNCEQIRSIKLQSENIQWKVINEQFYYIQQDNSFQLSLINLSNTQPLREVQFDKSIKQYIFNEYLIVLVDQEIIYYKNIIQSDQSITITQQTINQFHLGIVWKPSKLFTNPNSDTYFIINNEQLLITSSFDWFSIKDILDVYPINYLVASQNTFVIIQNQKLFQYNYIADVYFMNSLSLYQYEIADPLNGKIINDMLIIQTTDDNLLVYQLNCMSHNSLKQVVNFGTSYNQIIKQQPIITGSKCNGNLFIVIYYQKQITQYLYLQPKIQYSISNLNNNSLYVNNLNAMIYVQNNWDQILFEQILKLINTYTEITLNEDQLREDNNVYLNKQEQNIPLNNTWYIGQVINFTVQSEIDQVVKIHNLIDETDNQFSNQLYYNNIMQLDNQTKLLQGDNSITILNNEFQILQIINLELDVGFQCIQTVQDDQYFYSLCNNQSDSYLHVTIKQDSFPLGLSIKMNSKTQKIGFMDQHFVYLSDYSVKIANIVLKEFKIENQLVINAKYLKIINGTFHATDFEINSLGGNEWALQILDITDYLSILRITCNKDQFVIYDKQNINIKGFLINKENYLLYDTKFIFIKHLHYFRDLILNIRLLVITDNVGAYCITFTFNEQFRKQLDFALVQYGNWLTFNYQIHDKTIAILYRDEKKALIGIYNIDYTQQLLQFQRYSIKSGIQQNIDKNQDLFYYFNNTILYISEQNNEFQGHKINDEIVLTIKQAQERQHVNITAYNDFGQSQLDYIINYYIEPEQSNTWWIVLLCVLGGTIIVVVCFYFYKRRHPTKSVSSILLE